MRTLLVTLALLTIFALPGAASADTLTFNAPATAPDTAGNAGSNPGGPNQFDLDHHRAYTWQINNVNLPAGHAITGATLTFNSIRNWDTNPNRLFVHLFDTAATLTTPVIVQGAAVTSTTVNGVTSVIDNDPNASPVTDIQDAFAAPQLSLNPLITAGTGNTFLFDRSFDTTPTNYVFTFTSAQLQALAQYLANGRNLAFGFDPDCHFWNNGITFSITTAAVPTAVPEPTAMLLLGSGLAGLASRTRRQRRKATAAETV